MAVENVIAGIANQKRVADHKVPLRVWDDLEDRNRSEHEAARGRTPYLLDQTVTYSFETYLGAVRFLRAGLAHMKDLVLSKG